MMRTNSPNGFGFSLYWSRSVYQMLSDLKHRLVLHTEDYKGFSEISRRWKRPRPYGRSYHRDMGGVPTDMVTGVRPVTARKSHLGNLICAPIIFENSPKNSF